MNGTAVIVDYPGAPDSTVAHFRLPTPLAPHDSVRVVFEWDARPSTVPRRQGRRGRTFDFAQWYPKVAVYDRGGWEPNPLVPAGELYGEYGTYDVTMVVRDDQVLASTGVPVSGDPGWARVSRTGPPRLDAEAYASIAAGAAGHGAGGISRRAVPRRKRASLRVERVAGLPLRGRHLRARGSAHALSRRGTPSRCTCSTSRATTRRGAADAPSSARSSRCSGSSRSGGRTRIRRSRTSIASIAGGTEFPMMIMDGSASQGLILHEFGHVFTYGILGNNEWRSGWMDEGLTDYQTDWAQKLTPQERDRRIVQEPPRLPDGLSRQCGRRSRSRTASSSSQFELEVHGRAQPIGTHGGRLQ